MAGNGYQIECLEYGSDVFDPFTAETWSMRHHRMRHCPNAGFEVTAI